jgi:hypothetical protein
MSDDFTLDFSDVQAAGTFDAIPGGWYHVLVKGYQNTETKNAGKLPAGTPGTNWEFIVQAPEEYESRHLWTNHWHHQKTLPFLKNLFEACGAFTPEELEGSLTLEDRDRVVDTEVMCKVQKKKYEGNWTNNVQGFMSLDAFEESDNTLAGGEEEGAASMMP